MKKHARRLTLNRETILCLNDSALGGGAAAVVGVTVQDTQQPECYSPLCGPTFWKTCEETNLG
jgi:hypothetical protein